MTDVIDTAEEGKSKAQHMTVKLDASERERIKALATIKKRTPHYLMREAISRYLQEEEAEANFIAAAENAWDDMESTGLHITLDEVKRWSAEVKQNPQAAMPAAHN